MSIFHDEMNGDLFGYEVKELKEKYEKCIKELELKYESLKADYDKLISKLSSREN